MHQYEFWTATRPNEEGILSNRVRVRRGEQKTRCVLIARQSDQIVIV